MAKRKARQRAEIPASETKEQRFTRVVTPRVGKALKAIRLIGFCTGSVYEWTPEQVKQITDSLLLAVQSVESKFEAKEDKQQGFTFNGK